MKSTPVSAGPTQGVHAKLNVNPIRSAVTGDIARPSRLIGSLCVFPRMLLLPKIPIWYSPNTKTIRPPALVISTWYLLRKFPSTDTPSPSKIKAKLTPKIKKKVFPITLLLLNVRLPFSSRSIVPPERYPI